MASIPSIHGLLVLDKPGGMTSRDVVDRVQGWFPRRTRIGHTGTLDPLASGVLVLCLGSATRLAEYVQRMPKTYAAQIRLGARSDTDDADGTIEPTAVAQAPDASAVAACLQSFLGEISQVPPAYSAAKVSGRRAYSLARRGREVELEPRVVRIDQIDVRSYAYPHLDVTIHCGKGTYVRSLARDLGKRLGCGALVETLQRTHVGPFRADEAIDLTENAETARTHLLPLSAAVSELPRLELGPTDVTHLRQGKVIRIEQRPGLSGDETEIAVFDSQGELVGIGRLNGDGLLAPDKIMAFTP